MKIDIGIGDKERKRVADGLARVLADTYALAVKTHNYHWNVEGPHFPALHEMFEEQYKALAEATDEIAERIRALGHPAPGGLAAFAKLATVKDEAGRPDAAAMVKTLARDHETASKSARRVLEVAQAAADEATVDLMIERMAAHEKFAWMLRATAA
jgi:starvation-inducible DNA-binding protein